MRRFLPLVVAVLAAQVGTAQGLVVAYLDGDAQLKSGSAWKPLSTGDLIATDSSIRLGANALIEVKGPGTDFTLTKPGTYGVRDVVAAGRRVSPPGVGATVTTAMRYMTFGAGKNQSATMGARGADQSGSDEPQWADSSAQVFLDAGKEYIKAGRYDKAADQLRQALACASDEETPEIHYYLGYAFSLGGNVREAWKQTADLKPSPGEAWYGDFILLKARLLEDTSSCADAAALLTQEGGTLAHDPQRAPLYYFLLGLAYRGTGDGPRAGQALSTVVSLAGEADLGKTAAALLSQQ